MDGLLLATARSHGLVVATILRSWLFGVSPADPVTLAGVVAIRGRASLLACLAPALRAARADPIETLKAGYHAFLSSGG